MSFAHIETLMQRGQWDDAILECLAVIQVTPNNAVVHAYKGMCHYRKQEWESAADELRLATILDPKYVDAGVKLAQVLDKLNRHMEAYDVTQDFLKLQPGNRTLQGLAESLRHYIDNRRVDGWERSIRLNTRNIDHHD